MRILVFGDSITQGFNDEVSGGWCNRLVVEVMRQEVSSKGEYDRSVVNLGISGDTTTDLLKRIKSETEARISKYETSTHDVVILMIGVNDTQYDMDTLQVKMDLDETKQNLLEILAILKEFNVKTVFVGAAPVYEPRIQPMTWKPTHGYSNTLISERNTLIKRVAEENSCSFVDMSGVYERQEAEVLPDGIHPNAQGHEYIYKQVARALKGENIL